MNALLLAAPNRIINQDAVAISPTMGWLLLGCAVCVAAIFALQPDRWRRWWMTSEDPRGLAVFRIVFTFFLISNINGMWEYFEYLYTDEGIFTADVARQVFAAKQFEGFGDGMRPDEPWGFFDLQGWLTFLRGPKYSLLFFWDSPAFFWGHMVAFWVASISFLVGFRTRLAGVLTWFLMNSILTRNHLAWEGTEVVYRCFLAYLVLARSGHAYSVDNWLRCRKLRRQGRLSVPGGPGDGAGVAPSSAHPNGLEPIYRNIPSWPRKLIVLQLATVYLTTGALKNGSVWMSGDALYYALNLDHFYRLPPQYISSIAGTTLFRGMTWAVKFGQMLFPLVIVGMIVRWAAAQKFPPLGRPQTWGIRIAFAALILLSAELLRVAHPVHFAPPVAPETFAGLWIGLWAGLWAIWHKLGTRPFVVHRFGTHRFDRPVVIDRIWVSRWILGRRIWLVWHLAFHAHIFTLMSVGQFQTGMLSVTFAFLSGREIATLLRDIGHRLATWRVPFIPERVARGAPIVPSQAPELDPDRRGRVVLPMWALLVGLSGAVAGVLVAVWAKPSWDWRWVWVATLVFLAGVLFARWRSDRTVPDRCGEPPWSYGVFGRFVGGTLIVWHLTAVATWLLPDKDCLSSFRGEARRVFSTWLTHTTTEQGWGMFAPNPPRSNVFLKVQVTDADGEVWDLRTDVYAEEHKPMPWIWNTRLRKMNRRIIGGESGNSEWYRKWHARYHCRAWARDHGGEAPLQVELVRISYRIPSPAETRAKGYYVAEELLQRTATQTVVYTEHCRTAVMGQLPNFVRERDGLPLLEDGEYKPWVKSKRQKWERRH